MTQILKKLPLWFWAVLVIVLFLFLDHMAGYGVASKLYKSSLDYLRQDQSKVIQTLEDSQKMYEAEIQRLSLTIQSIQKEKASIQAENQKLKGKVNELQSQRENISVPNSPDDLVSELHKLGIKSAHRRKGPAISR